VHFNADASHLRAEAADRVGAFLPVASDEHKPSAQCAEPLSGLKPDSAGCAGDHTRFCFHDRSLPMQLYEYPVVFLPKNPAFAISGESYASG
jgi:hypothetical protein